MTLIYSNPMQQAKEQTNGLLHLLEREFPERFNGSAPIGFIVAHAGFTRLELEEKFPKLQGAADYWKHHMTVDEMGTALSERLREAAKFQRKIPEDAIDDILRIVQFREQLASESSILKLELESKLLELDQKINMIATSEQQNVKVEQHHPTPANAISRKSYKLFLFIAVLVVVLVLVATALFQKESSKTTQRIQQVDDIGKYEGKSVTVSGEVQSFHFDEGTGMKFLAVQDQTGSIAAVVFKDTKVPFIREGQHYEIAGKVQKYKGHFQIVIDKVTAH